MQELVAIPLALILHTLPAGTLKLNKRMTTIGITIICTCIGEPIGCNFNTQSKIALLGYRQQSRYKLYTSHKVVSSACMLPVHARSHVLLKLSILARTTTVNCSKQQLSSVLFQVKLEVTSGGYCILNHIIKI